MRIFVTLFLLVFLVASVASAELMTTADTLGQGKWAVLGLGLSDSNVGANNSGLTATSYGGYVAYGLTQQLDLYVNLGSMTINGLLAGLSSSTAAYGASLKYGVLAEGGNIPVSVAVAGGYKILSNTTSWAGTMAGSQIMGGVGVSKMLIPFIPYCGVVYRSTGGDVGTSTQIDATAGTAIAWSAQGAVFVEYTLQSISPSVGSSYSSGQIGAGVGYII